MATTRRRPLPRRARPRLPGERRRARLQLARHDDPAADDDRAPLGRERTTPLISPEDDGRWVVVASKGGTPAAPALVREPARRSGRAIQVRAEHDPGRRATTATGEERARLWSQADRGVARLRRVPGEDRPGDPDRRARAALALSRRRPGSTAVARSGRGWRTTSTGPGSARCAVAHEHELGRLHRRRAGAEAADRDRVRRRRIVHQVDHVDLARR